MKKLTAIHPGEILSEEFLEPKGISQSRLARSMVPPRRINEICLGKRGITPDTALRLGLYFGVAAEFWMNLQQRFDLETRRDQIAGQLRRDIRPLSPRAA
jgi:addiction module HigA family antidote